MATLLLFFLSILFTTLTHSSSPMSSITAVTKDQEACTMCSSCDNPCQPIYSPPPPPQVPSPPPRVPSPPPPSPPPPTGPICPPPPAPPSGGGGGGNGGGAYYFSPPPQAQPNYNPLSTGGGSYNPPSGVYGYATPPPNPIVSYFPYYYYNPPSGHSDDSHSMKFKNNALLSWFVILFSSLFLSLN